MSCTCAKFYFLNKNIYLCSKTTVEMLRYKYSRLNNLNLLRQRHIRLQLFKYDVKCLREFNSLKFLFIWTIPAIFPCRPLSQTSKLQHTDIASHLKKKMNSIIWSTNMTKGSFKLGKHEVLSRSSHMWLLSTPFVFVVSLSSCHIWNLFKTLYTLETNYH